MEEEETYVHRVPDNCCQVGSRRLGAYVMTIRTIVAPIDLHQINPEHFEPMVI